MNYSIKCAPSAAADGGGSIHREEFLFALPPIDDSTSDFNFPYAKTSFSGKELNPGLTSPDIDFLNGSKNGMPEHR